MHKFEISKRHWRHSGPTDAYYVKVATVEARDLADAPFVYAAKKGFPRNSVIRVFETMFRIGDSEYQVSPN